MARRTFGETWWGRSWVDALEQRARLDPNRLPRGRTYARQGRVGDVAVQPGAIRSSVRGQRRYPYNVNVRFRTLTSSEWDTVLDVIVTKAARAAALLDGELDPGLVADASAAGVELLPNSGDLHPSCSCPDWADLCKHAAATCYLVADELDADPFALLYLRGRSRSKVLAAVRERRSGARNEVENADVTGVRADTGVRAADAWRTPLAALPDLPKLALEPSRGAAWPTDPPDDAAFTTDGLSTLVADAAFRAWSALNKRGSLAFDLTEDQDVARRAAALLGAHDLTHNNLDRLAGASGLTGRTLITRGVAWQVAGAAGLAILDEQPWRADPLIMASARADMIAAGVSAKAIRTNRNRMTFGSIQLRLGLDRHWYRFTKRANAWQLSAGPEAEAEDLLD